jgi:hypothetical protein
MEQIIETDMNEPYIGKVPQNGFVVCVIHRTSVIAFFPIVASVEMTFDTTCRIGEACILPE